MIGISIGSLNSVIGVFKQNNVDVILSSTSNRAVPVIVSYNDRERVIGDNALLNLKSNIKRSFDNLPRFLGLTFASLDKISEEAQYSLNAPRLDQNGKISFEIDYKNQTDNYTPESLLGLFFAKLRNHWRKEGYKTNDVVVSVPDYYDSNERRAMLNALAIANLKCVSLINESSAIALSYGLLRQRELDVNDRRIVGFIDMGHAKLNVFYCSFTKKDMKVFSVTSERFCGGREFDFLLAKHLASVFEKQYGCNPMTNAKTKLRLLEAVSKARKQLTVNKDVTIGIDSLMDGEDLQYLLTRNEFEEIVSPIINKYTAVLQKSIIKLQEDTKMTIDLNKDLHSIEMVGDAVRTPILQSIIKDLYNRELSKTLLPDECISRGCVLFHAMNNPFMKIVDFTFEHYNHHLIKLNYSKGDQSQQMTIFSPGDNLKVSKSITLTNKQISGTISDNTTIVHVSLDTETITQDYYIDLMNNPLNDDTQLTLLIELDQNGIWNISKCTLQNQTFCGMKSSIAVHSPHLTYSIQREIKQEEEDKAFIQVAHRRNQIEQFIYTLRERMRNALLKYATDEERKEIEKEMEEVINWFYSGDDTIYNWEELERRSKQIYLLGEAIEGRVKAWNGLEEKIEEIERDVMKSEEKIKGMVNTRRRSIEVNNARKMQSMINVKRKRIEALKEYIAKAIRTEMPKVDSKEIEKKIKEEEPEEEEEQDNINDLYNRTVYKNPNDRQYQPQQYPRQYQQQQQQPRQNPMFRLNNLDPFPHRPQTQRLNTTANTTHNNPSRHFRDFDFDDALNPDFF